jgi:voltage-gated potassium channel Kch
MRKVTLRDRFRYSFDNIMSSGPAALIGLLFVLTVSLVIVFSLFVLLTGTGPAADSGSQPGLLDLMWSGFKHTLATSLLGMDRGSALYQLAALAVTLGGIFIVGSLIGVLSSGIQGKLADLRKGRSFVVEQNHTVILGWSEQVIPIVRELCAANATKPHSCIAILAEKDKVEMEDEIRARAGHTGRTRIVCRTGDPLVQADLAIVNPQASRSIIIPTPAGRNPDAHAIKTLLALMQVPGERSRAYHIVAEIRNPDNLDVARLVAHDEAELVQASDFIPRIVAQTCRQSGLSVVYTELLDFRGDEISMREEAGLVGKTFGEALFAYERSAVIGLAYADGRVQVSPPQETRLAAGDRVIGIFGRGRAIRLSDRTRYVIDEGAIAKAQERARAIEHTLILGYNRNAPIIISELDSYVAPGSEVRVVASHGEGEAEVRRIAGDLHNQTCSYKDADVTDRGILETLGVDSYQHVIVLSDSDTMQHEAADAHTLITLLHLRDIAEHGGQPFSITSEMMDVRNRDLAVVTQADDFVVGPNIVSLMMAQFSENKDLRLVFRDLFDPEGVEIYLKPAEDYVVTGRAVNFYTVLESARRRREIAIGYRVQARAKDPAQTFGVRLNPNKSRLVTFAEGDTIVVVAES